MKYLTLLFLSLTITACKVKDLPRPLIDQFINYTKPPSETYSKIDEPARILPANPAGCPTWGNNSINHITESMSLPQGCKYDRVKLIIANQSNITLDCNGAQLNGLDKEFRQKPNTTYELGREPIDIGILIISNEDHQINNITVKNCNLKNYVRGIRVSFSISATTISDLKNNINVEALENYLRTISPTNILVEHSAINFSHKDGIYIDRFINGFILDRSSINSTGSVGLYLDSGSTNSHIKNSSFTKNGYSRYVIKSREITKNLVDYSREGIAIDSSFNNRIEGNSFSNNSRGSVFLYKNCNEFREDPNQIPRYQSTDGNIITGNKFDDEDVGVWIASRQSEDLKGLECGIPKVATGTKYYGPYARNTYFYEDYAKNNQVLNNEFKNIRFGVIVEDDGNTINGNTFIGAANTDIKVGTIYRTEKLSNPVKNTTIKANHFNSSATNKILLKYSPTSTVILDNLPADVNQ